jgi:hypothetical protein
MQLNLSNIDFRHTYEKQSGDQCLINAPGFPKKRFDHIFSYLSNVGASVHHVCRDWSQRLVVVEKNKLLLLNSFIAFSEGKLSSQMINVDMDLSKLDLEEMVKLRHSVIKLKLSIIDELKIFDRQDLRLLEGKLQPLIQATFIENIFSLYQIYRNKCECDRCKEKFNDMYDIFLCYNFIKEHKMNNHVEKYINSHIRQANDEICEFLVDEGDLKKALRVANLHFQKSSSISCINTIIKSLMKINLQKALEVVSISTFGKAYETYKVLIRELIKEHRIEIVSEVINNLIFENENTKTRFRNFVIRALLEFDDIQMILRWACHLNSELERDEAYKKIALVLITRGELDMAPRVIDLIKKGPDRDKILSEAHLAGIENQIALGEVPLINLHLLVDSDKKEGYDLSASEWMTKGELDKVLEIANEISLCKILQVIDQLLASNHLTKALEFGSARLEDKEDIYGKITAYFIKNGKVDEAYKTAMTPESDLDKVYSLQIIANYYLELGDFLQFFSILSKIKKLNDDFLHDSALILETKYRKYEAALELLELTSEVFRQGKSMLIARIQHKLEFRNKNNALKAQPK